MRGGRAARAGQRQPGACVRPAVPHARAPAPRLPSSKALLQRRGVLVNMTGDEDTLRLATGARRGAWCPWGQCRAGMLLLAGSGVCLDACVRRAPCRPALTLDLGPAAAPRHPAAHVDAFLDSLPAVAGVAGPWDAPLVRANEALVVPTQVNYVCKAANLYEDAGYQVGVGVQCGVGVSCSG